MRNNLSTSPASFPIPAIPASSRHGILNISHRWELLALIGLLLFGYGLRMINLNDPPLGFHPTRQLRAAIIARGMYYEALPGVDPETRQTAIDIWSTMERYEPPILESLVARTYLLLGGEYLWVAHVYSSLFWIIGGVALFALVRRVLSPGAALFALGFYLILPWGVMASRAFQPDPWMVMWILLSAYALYRWSESGLRSWRWGLLSGVFCGLAILIKANAVFPTASMALWLLAAWLFEEGSARKRLFELLLRPQLWVFATLSALIPAVYYLGLGDRSASFASFWIFSFTAMLGDSKFYIRWLALIRGLMDVMALFAALLGAFLYPRRARALVIGFWMGYLLIGITFPYQIYTHDYYSLMLVPLVAISLAPIANSAFTLACRQPLAWKAAFFAVALVIAGYYAYVARSQLLASNHTNEPIPWQIMGQNLPRDGTIIGLTHDYGNRLKYFGWRTVVRIWPAQGDLNLSAAAGGDGIGDFAAYFKSQTEDMDYFLVTLFGDLQAQPDLKAMLYDHYPVYQQGDGYVLFDLRHPLP